MNQIAQLGLKPDEGITFLKHLDEKGIHQLVRIRPNLDGGEDEIDAITFRLPGDESKATQFIKQHGSTSNLYFALNEVHESTGNRRAKKSDYVAIRVIGADVDPKKGVPQTPAALEAERARLLDLCEGLEAEPDCFPSSVTYSGGGVQICWRLAEKLPATQENIALAEDQTRGVLQHLGAGGGTTDISRLFRLPGTLNFPNKPKMDAGRTEVRKAYTIRLNPDAETDLAELAAFAPPVAASTSTSKAKSGEHKAQVDEDAVLDAASLEKVPLELWAKFKACMVADDALARLWGGEKPKGADQTGSGFRFALAAALRDRRQHRTYFNETEFGQLVAIWDHGDSNITPRELNRAWDRAPEQAPADEEMEAVLPLQMRWVDPFEASAVPKRQWVAGRLIARRNVSVLVSAPGVGKTTFLLMMALAVASGRDDILGFKIHERTRVMLWNQEDDNDELNRRLLAVMAQFNVSWDDLSINGERALMIGSGVDRPLILARRGGSSDSVRATPDAKIVEDIIRDNGIGLAIFDPLLELHEANENDNGEMNAVVRVFRQIAVRAGCGVMIAHHTRKPPAAANRESYAGNMDAARGGGSIMGVVRMGATLYPIDDATAKRYGVAEADKHRYIRFDDGKGNMSLISGEPTFFKRVGVNIGGIDDGEEIGVLQPVELTRAKPAAEVRKDEDAMIRDAVLALLRDTGGRAAVVDIVNHISDGDLLELTSPDTLKKRIVHMFREPVTYDGGDVVRSENGSSPGVPGRRAFLVVKWAKPAESGKQL